MDELESACRSSEDDWLLAYASRIRTVTGGDKSILELGCGRGRDTIRLGQLGPVVALELDERSLLECRRRAPLASLVCANLANDLPLRSDAFRVVVASLCLHYFTWMETVHIVGEIRRVLVENGLLLVRVNSTRDTNYGAVGYPEIEPNLYRVGEHSKRFFDSQSLHALLDGWRIDSMEEQSILRYEKVKRIWAVCAYLE